MPTKIKSFDDVVNLTKKALRGTTNKQVTDEHIDALIYAARSEAMVDFVDWCEVTALAQEDGKLDVDTIREIGVNYFARCTDALDMAYPQDGLEESKR